MKIKRMDLSWITSSNIKKAKDFFANDLGLELVESNDNYGWLEFEAAEGGARLGVGQYSQEYSPDDKPGMNAVISMSVDNLEAAKEELEAKGVRFVGSIIEVPGQVKMATFLDHDGNKFQLVEEIHKAGCCC